MPTSALVATQLTDHTSRVATLTIGGMDVLEFVDISSVRVHEEGYNGVSSMTFTLFDPTATMTVADSARVEFWNITLPDPFFAGFVQSTTVSTNARGRAIDVQCQGAEAVLDWMKVPEVTFLQTPQVTVTSQAVQTLVALAYGVGVSLNTASTTSDNGGEANPVGDLGPTNAAALPFDLTIEAGTSLREAIRLVLENSTSDGGADGPHVEARFTVDFRFGLRLWRTDGVPGDYSALSIVDTLAAVDPDYSATVLEHERDAGGTIEGVYINGGNAAGSGFVGSLTKPGPIDTINDSTILTTAKRNAVAAAYLLEHGPAERGHLTFSIGALGSDFIGKVHPGSVITITDAQVGLSAQSYTIEAIDRTFAPGQQTIGIAYGGLRPSAMREIRRHLPRGVIPTS